MDNKNLDPLAVYSVITYLRREIDSYYVCARIAELEGKSNSDIAYYHDQWLIYSWIYKQLVSTNEDLKEQIINLCASCDKSFATCKKGEKGKDFFFGIDLGFDNVYKCKEYSKLKIKGENNG